MPYCRECGASVDERARYCTQCAAPVDGTAPPTLLTPSAQVDPPIAPVATTPMQLRYNPTLEAAKAKQAAGRRLKSSERLELMRDAEAHGQKVSGLDKTSATLDVLGKGSCAGGCLLAIVAIVIAAIAAALHTSFWVVVIAFAVVVVAGVVALRRRRV